MKLSLKSVTREKIHGRINYLHFFTIAIISAFFLTLVYTYYKIANINVDGSRNPIYYAEKMIAPYLIVINFTAGLIFAGSCLLLWKNFFMVFDIKTNKMHVRASKPHPLVHPF